MRKAAYLLGGVVCLFMPVIAKGGEEIADPRYSNTIVQMTAYITSNMAANHIAGLSIALVDSNQVVWARGFGYADSSNAVPAATDTVYSVASISKVFTAVAVMQLQEQGLLDIDAPVTNYLTQFTMLPRYTNAAPITARMIMDMHSGIPGDAANDRALASVPTASQSDWILHVLANDYPIAPPDFIRGYSQNSYEVLEKLIEAVAQTNLADYAHSHIFTPIGMPLSSYGYTPAVGAHLSQFYLNNRLYPPQYANYYGALGMFSSVSDLAEFIKTILNGGVSPSAQTILSNATIIAMGSPQATNVLLDVNTNYCFGLGWDNVYDPALSYAGNVYRSRGGGFSHRSQMILVPTQQLGVVVLQNSFDEIAYATAVKTLQEAIYDKTSLLWPTNTYEPPYSPVTNWAQEALASLTGIYLTASTYSRVLAPSNGTLTEITYGGLTNELVPRLNGWFSLSNSQAVQLEFTNISGYDLILQHDANLSQPQTTLYGVRYQPANLSTAWLNRLTNTYLAVDYSAIAYEWTNSIPGGPYFMVNFQERNGVLVINSPGGANVITPQNDDLAYLSAFFNRYDSAVQVTQVDGVETLYFGGLFYRSLSTFEELPARINISNSISTNDVAWYHFSAQAGRSYRFIDGSNALFRVFDSSFLASVAFANNGRLCWKSPTNATYWLAITATNQLSFNIVLLPIIPNVSPDYLLLLERDDND